ncbi:MAG: hypothetical protein ACKO32_04370, partial [Planctomycetia bacterium]
MFLRRSLLLGVAFSLSTAALQAQSPVEGVVSGQAPVQDSGQFVRDELLVAYVPGVSEAIRE